jgi:hypothetical protein
VAVAAAEGTPVRCYFAGGLCSSGSELAPVDSRAFLIDARGQDVELRPTLVHLLESFCAGSGDSVTGYVQRGARWEPRFDRGSVLGYVRNARRPETWPRLGPWRQAVLVRTTGGWVADPFGVMRLLSAERRQVLRARLGAELRARLKRRPLVRVEKAAAEITR